MTAVSTVESPVLDQIVGAPEIIFHSEERVGSIYNRDDLFRACDALHQGKAIIINMLGVQGFVVKGTSIEAASLVAGLKGRRLEENPLVAAASNSIRRKLIDGTRLPDFMSKYLNTDPYVLPHFFEYPVLSQKVPDTIGLKHPVRGRVAALFGAEYFKQFWKLEDILRSQDSGSFLAGSSANIHRESPCRTADESLKVFGRYKLEVPFILRDNILEFRKPFIGSHVILGLNEKFNRVVPLRPGSIRLESFKQIYRSDLEIPGDWVEVVDAINVDMDTVKSKESYY